MNQRKLLWNLSIGLFCTGLYLTAYPAFAGVSASEVTFPLGQVSLLMAVAAAWGDMRAQVKDLRREVEEIKGRKEKS